MSFSSAPPTKLWSKQMRMRLKKVAQEVERAMCAAGEEYLKTVPVKVEAEIADEWVK
jgi:hypothetical protein